MGRVAKVCAFVVVGVGLLSACSPTTGSPERQETFTVQGGECSAQWWLEPMTESVPKQASEVARRTLTSAAVSTSEIEEWKSILLDAQSGDRQIPEHRLEGFAYAEAVRAEVRSELEKAGYPDAPIRMIEVHADVECRET